MPDSQAASALEPSAQVDTDAAASIPEYNSTALADSLSTTNISEIISTSTSTGFTTHVGGEPSATTLKGVDSKLVDAMGRIEIKEIRISAVEDAPTSTRWDMASSQKASASEDAAQADNSGSTACSDSSAHGPIVVDDSTDSFPKAPTIFSTSPTSQAYIEATFGQDSRPALLEELDRVVQLTKGIMDPKLEAILRLSCEEQNTILVQDWYTSNLDFAQSLRVQPSIWLAGQIIASEPTLHFFHALLFGPKILVWGQDGKMRKTFHRTSVDRPLTPEQRERVIDRMQFVLFHSRVEFKHRDPPATRYGSAGTDGVIEINAKALDAIPELDFCLDRSDDIVKEWVFLAYTLVHELAHRMNQEHCDHELGFMPYTMLGGEKHEYDCQEMTFERDEFAEMGYAFENFLIGGTLHESPDGIILLRSLPNPGWLDNAPNDPDHVPYPSAPLKDLEEVVVVPFEWLWSHFDPKFWAEEMPRTSGDALKLPQDFRYQYWYLANMNEPVDDELLDDEPEVSSEVSTTLSTLDLGKELTTVAAHSW